MTSDSPDPLPHTPSPRILVDADACPVKEEIYKVAWRRDVPVVLVSNARVRSSGTGVKSIMVPLRSGSSEFGKGKSSVIRDDRTYADHVGKRFLGVRAEARRRGGGFAQSRRGTQRTRR